MVYDGGLYRVLGRNLKVILLLIDLFSPIVNEII